jgi:hypothetical protein
MLNDGVDYTKVMFGENAVHCGFNMIVQDAGDGKIIVVAQSTSPQRGQKQHPLQFGSKRTHVLCMGDIVVRPHMVFGSDAFRGAGLNNLIRNAFTSPEQWIDEGDVILDVVSRTAEMNKNRR